MVEYQSVHKQGEKKYVRPSVPGEKHLLLRKYVNRNTLLAIGKEHMLCVGQRHQRYSIMVQALN